MPTPPLLRSPLHPPRHLLYSSQVLNGHFVHYFAPSNLPAVPKNVVFVIDTSASMLGKKIRQVRDNVLLPAAICFFVSLFVFEKNETALACDTVHQPSWKTPISKCFFPCLGPITKSCSETPSKKRMKKKTVWVMMYQLFPVYPALKIFLKHQLI